MKMCMFQEEQSFKIPYALLQVYGIVHDYINYNIL